jgi:NitT/TauT family transport system substrate-binding protein
MNRLGFACLAFALALLATAGLSSRAVQAESMPKIRVATFPIDVTAPAYYALDQGFFKKAGLDAEVITGQNGAAVAAAVIGGSLDFGDANTAVLAAAHEHGLPLVLVAPNGIYDSRAPTAAVVVARNSPIRTASDFKGKTVGVLVLKGIAEIGAKAWLEAKGVDIKSVRFVEVTLSEMGPALTAGRIDAVVTEEPQLSKIMASGDGRIVSRPYDAIGARWEQGAYFCTLAYAKAHPDIVRKFSEAIASADAWANKNHVGSAKILEKYLGSPILPNQVRIAYPLALHAADLQPLIDAAAKYGALKKPFPAEEMMAPGIGP